MSTVCHVAQEGVRRFSDGFHCPKGAKDPHLSRNLRLHPRLVAHAADWYVACVNERSALCAAPNEQARAFESVPASAYRSAGKYGAGKPVTEPKEENTRGA